MAGEAELSRRALAADFADRTRRGELDLDEGAAILGAIVDPAHAPAATLAALDDLAAGLTGDDVDAVIEWFRSTGLRGDDVDYTDPLNSSIGAVLERGCGIPITLSVIVIEVARRVGVELDGVGMPGHFLVRVDDDQFLDAFDGARRLDRRGAEGIHSRLFGHTTGFHPSYLAAVDGTAILTRMCANLKGSLVNRNDLDRLRWILRAARHLPGSSPTERERLAALLGARARFDEAAAELEDLAADGGDGDDADRLRESARRLAARLN